MKNTVPKIPKMLIKRRTFENIFIKIMDKVRENTYKIRTLKKSDYKNYGESYYKNHGESAYK